MTVTYLINSHTLTITYVTPDGVTAPTTFSQSYTYGAPYSVDSPVIEGYTPDAATVSGNMPDNDVNVTVTYSINSYTLTINYQYANGTEAAPTHTEPVNYNEGYAVTSPDITGYTPDIAVVSGTMGTENVTVNVTYGINSYTIAASASPEDFGSVSGAGTYDHFQPCSLTATPNLHHYFINWTENDVEVSTDAVYEFEVTEARTLVAHFAEIIYQVTAYAVPASFGTVSGAGSYVEGEIATLVASPAEGREFVNWTKNGIEVSNALSYSFEVTNNVNLLAHFKPIPGTVFYTIVANANPVAGGTISGTGEYAEGSNVTLVATPNEGYHFVSWSENGDVVAATESYTFLADADRTLVANFEFIPMEYTITIEEVDHAEISAPASSVAGETITVNVALEPMYHLAHLFYYTTDPEIVFPINLNTKQFIMPEANVTIGAEIVYFEGKGDVNLDGVVNILDILTTINYILGDDPQPFDLELADMDDDGEILLNDAVAINALILGLRGNCCDIEVTCQIVDGQLFIDSDVPLAGYQFRLSAEPASIGLDGFTTMGRWNNGEYILVVFNLNGEKEAGLYSVLDMGDASLNSIVMSTKEGCKVRGIHGIVNIASFNESNYSVYPVPANNEVTVAGPDINTIEVFNMLGKKVMTVTASSFNTVVNLSNLSVGSYLFRINTSYGIITKNVIVAR